MDSSLNSFQKENSKETAVPMNASKRYVFLDALRAIALLGVCLANYPEFSLFSFLSTAAREEIGSSGIDKVVQFLLYFLIDGKFYTIFSLLFGIGFSIILGNARLRGASGLRIFYRRMGVLFLIGIAHLIFVWSGDILALYALMGLAMTLFMNVSNRSLLIWASFFLALPVAIDFGFELAGINPSSKLVEWQWRICEHYGITEGNFAVWLRDSRSYSDVSAFLMQGAVERMQEFVDGNRYFKVLGLFLIGFYVGRNEFYKNLESVRPILRSLLRIGLFGGIPLSLIYAYSCTSHHPYGEGLHSLLYLSSVYLTGFGYVAGASLLYLRFSRARIWKILSYPGRMALTCYIGQSLIGMLLFYGTGFGLGAITPLWVTELIALVVFIAETVICIGWLTRFRFGPLEWMWRCLTYGKVFSLKKNRTSDC